MATKHLTLLLVIVVAICCGPGSTQPVQPPNIVLFVSDTHRWGAMSFTQTPQVETPNMEQLKQEGVSLNRYYVNLPICTPYRAILMSGHWPYQQGLMANHMSLGQRVDMPAGQEARGTLSWAFKDADYITGYFGKWHLGGRDARPFGFDKSIIWGATNNHRRCRYSTDGEDYVEWEGLSNSTATTMQALDWLSERSNSKRPFFTVISVNPPHGPFHDALEDKKALYPDEEKLPFHPLDSTRDFEQPRDYHALISGIDDDVGLVMTKLEELGITDNTILVYTSNHGAMTGIEGVAYGQKRHPNDESSRVPFLVRWPDQLPADLDVEVPVSTIDVFPTLISLAGMQLETSSPSYDYITSLPGTDLSGLLRGEPGSLRPEAVFLSHPSNMNNGGSRHEILWRAIVTDEYTYAITEDGEHRMWENKDGYQDKNLLSDPEHVATRKHLWSRLNALMDQAERPFYDNWFARAAEKEVSSWNKEHGLESAGANRTVSRNAVFDMTKSRP